MTLLAYPELIELVNSDVILNVSPNHVNSSSIDLTLGSKILTEVQSRIPSQLSPMVFLIDRDSVKYREVIIDKHYYLAPGEFILAHTEQKFFLPNDISAEYKLKSSLARNGLEHLNAGWADAGWNGSVLTLELKNMTRDHTLVLTKGMPIGQMVFFKHTPVPPEKSYAQRGRYNNDTSVHGVKL